MKSMDKHNKSKKNNDDNSNDSYIHLLSYKLELYKSLLDRERERRENASARMFNSIAIILALAGALIWLCIEFVENYNIMKLSCVNFMFLVASIICSVCVVIFLCLTLFGYKSTEQDPEIIKKIIDESDDENSIDKINTSLADAYIEGAIEDYKENNRYVISLNRLYNSILVDVIVICMTFIFQIFCTI